MKTSEHLKAAKAKIATKDTWSTGALARTRDNITVKVDSPAACKFCAVGAFIVTRESGLLLLGENFAIPATKAWSLITRAARTCYGVNMETVNDTLGFDAVHFMYDRAISDALKLEENENADKQVSGTD